MWPSMLTRSGSSEWKMGLVEFQYNVWIVWPEVLPRGRWRKRRRLRRGPGFLGHGREEELEEGGRNRAGLLLDISTHSC